jgi:AraC-like DNA-binding protein
MSSRPALESARFSLGRPGISAAGPGEPRLFYSLQGPLDVLPVSGQIRAGEFQGFPEFVRRRGGDPRSILERHGMDPRTIADADSYVDCHSFVAVLEYCGSLFEERLFGLRLARAQDPDVLGCVGALCRAAPTFGDAMRCFTNYIPVIHSPGARLALLEGGETAELRHEAQTDIGAHDQSNYHGMVLTVKLLRQIGGTDFRPSYVTLTVDAGRKDISEIESSVGCEFRRSDRNAIAFPARWLERRTAHCNKLLFSLLSGYLECARTTPRTTVVERVQDYVQSSLSSGHCSIENCARKLGISARLLQLRLSDYGVRFLDVLRQERIRLAKSYLERGELSLDKVACLLGYCEQSSFGRAFRRWTGSTPQSYRDRVSMAGLR